MFLQYFHSNNIIAVEIYYCCENIVRNVIAVGDPASEYCNKFYCYRRRHLGDLGNVIKEHNGKIYADFYAPEGLTLIGSNSIIGRGLVVSMNINYYILLLLPPTKTIMIVITIIIIIAATTLGPSHQCSICEFYMCTAYC